MEDLSQLRLLQQNTTDGWLEQRHLFLTDLRAEKSKTKEQADLKSGENLYPSSSTVTFWLEHQTAERRETVLVSPRRALTSFGRALP